MGIKKYKRTMKRAKRYIGPPKKSKRALARALARPFRVTLVGCPPEKPDQIIKEYMKSIEDALNHPDVIKSIEQARMDMLIYGTGIVTAVPLASLINTDGDVRTLAQTLIDRENSNMLMKLSKKRSRPKK